MQDMVLAILFAGFAYVRRCITLTPEQKANADLYGWKIAIDIPAVY